MQTSKQIDDPWLGRVSADFLSREDLGNSDIYLPDDLSKLIILPAPIWNTERDGRQVLLESFALNGESISRKDHFLVYSRPNEQPELHKQTEPPARPIMIDGRLLMRAGTDDTLQIIDLNNKVVFSHRLKSDEKPLPYFDRVDDKQLVFTQTPIGIFESHKADYETLKVARWDYANDKLTQYSISIRELFELKSDGYYPTKGISIDQPKK